MYTVEVLGTRKHNSVQGSRPVSGQGAPPCEEELHIHFSLPFSLFFSNLSSAAVLFVGKPLPFVHKRSLPPLLVNVTGRELVCGAAIIMIMAGRKIEGCCPSRPPLMGLRNPSLRPLILLLLLLEERWRSPATTLIMDVVVSFNFLIFEIPRPHMRVLFILLAEDKCA